MGSGYQAIESRSSYQSMGISAYWGIGNMGLLGEPILFANHKANGAVTNKGFPS